MTQIDTLPPLRAVIANHGLSARKSLGQNFLLDLNLTAKIARHVGDLSQSDVLEIGPGQAASPVACCLKARAVCLPSKKTAAASLHWKRSQQLTTVASP